MTLYETLAHLDIQIKKNNSVACNISNKFEFKLFDIMKQWKIDQVTINKQDKKNTSNKKGCLKIVLLCYYFLGSIK